MNRATQDVAPVTLIQNIKYEFSQARESNTSLPSLIIKHTRRERSEKKKNFNKYRLHINTKYFTQLNDLRDAGTQLVTEKNIYNPGEGHGKWE